MGSDNIFGKEYFNPTQTNKIMKKYFAKYLPVEGEIMNGDLVYDVEGAYGVVENVNRPLDFVRVRYEKSFYSDSLKTNLKKVKLFLCSRDIRVGDKVKHLIGKEVEVYKINKNEVLIQDGVNIVHVLKGDLFKVIGEISPNAKWVKEGDEFDKEELCCYLKAGFNTGSLDNELPFTEEDSSRLYYGIKGSCGHFH